MSGLLKVSKNPLFSQEGICDVAHSRTEKRVIGLPSYVTESIPHEAKELQPDADVLCQKLPLLSMKSWTEYSSNPAEGKTPLIVNVKPGEACPAIG
jgi:hypothetical protein